MGVSGHDGPGSRNAAEGDIGLNDSAMIWWRGHRRGSSPARVRPGQAADRLERAEVLESWARPVISSRDRPGVGEPDGPPIRRDLTPFLALNPVTLPCEGRSP